MELRLIRHLWGVAETWETCFPRFAAAGYKGVELAVPEAGERERLRRLLTAHELEYIPMIFTRGDTPDENVESFRRQIGEAMTFSPRVINCHSGKDCWDDSENMRFYEQAVQIEQESGAPVAHETHRKRTFFNPWSTSKMLQKIPQIRLCCDFSQWVCVCERLLDGCEGDLQLAARHALHIHARVGYAEGPQVSDPRAAEWANELTAHERWWDLVWEAQALRGMKVSTLTPEFGPPPYLQTLPHSGMPVADLEQICDWQARRQAERFSLRKS